MVGLLLKNTSGMYLENSSKSTNPIPELNQPYLPAVVESIPLLVREVSGRVNEDLVNCLEHTVWNT